MRYLYNHKAAIGEAIGVIGYKIDIPDVFKDVIEYEDVTEEFTNNLYESFESFLRNIPDLIVLYNTEELYIGYGISTEDSSSNDDCAFLPLKKSYTEMKLHINKTMEPFKDHITLDDKVFGLWVILQ